MFKSMGDRRYDENLNSIKEENDDDLVEPDDSDGSAGQSNNAAKKRKNDSNEMDQNDDADNNEDDSDDEDDYDGEYDDEDEQGEDEIFEMLDEFDEGQNDENSASESGKSQDADDDDSGENSAEQQSDDEEDGEEDGSGEDGDGDAHDDEEASEEKSDSEDGGSGQQGRANDSSSGPNKFINYLKDKYDKKLNGNRNESKGSANKDDPFSHMYSFVQKGQSYQIVKSCDDIYALEKRQFQSKWDRELFNIGECVYKTKSLIYGLKEVEFFDKVEYRKALEKRYEDKRNRLLKDLVDHRFLFKKYLDPTNQNGFQKAFNPFLLFILNNSQDELLMAYSDFCKRYFKAGLPSKQSGRLPQKFIRSDFRELEQFFQQKNIMDGRQYASIIAPFFEEKEDANDQENLGRGGGKSRQRWNDIKETDIDGKPIKTILFELALPYIMLAFYCFITQEVYERQTLIAKQEQVKVQKQSTAEIDAQGVPTSTKQVKSKTCLSACFEKAGLKNDQWFQRSVSYSMAENAILYYQQKDKLNIDQIELILRMVRERMGVHQMHRCESQKEYFDHPLPRKSFGRWLLAEIALQKKMKELAVHQEEYKEMNRDRFHRQLIWEEKLMQIAKNEEKLDHLTFVRMVTKNLMILLHARKKYGIFLDLDNHKSIKDALRAQLKIEEEKAKDGIMKEYRERAQKQFEKYETITKQKEKDKIEDELAQWRYDNQMIIKQKEEYLEQTSAENNYKLFKETMDEEYWHSLFETKKDRSKKGSKIVNQKGYSGPTNLHHFTVHEFNEALYFAMREFSTYINFSQIENATYGFFMDQILSEQKIKKEQSKNSAYQYERPQRETYPIHGDQPDKFYWRIFVNEYPSKTIFNEPKLQIKDKDAIIGLYTFPKDQKYDRAGLPIKVLADKNFLLNNEDIIRVSKYQDTLLVKNVSDHIRKRDRDKIMKLKHTETSLQSEVEVFRYYKLCDLEFTRFAYQIVIDEAHRQSMQTMILMYLSSPRSIHSHKDDPAIKQNLGIGIGEKYETYKDRYEKLKRNNYLTKKELTSIRKDFMEDRIKKIRKKREKQLEDKEKANGINEENNQNELDFVDLHYPLNAIGKERYKKWKKSRQGLQIDIKNQIDKIKNEEQKKDNLKSEEKSKLQKRIDDKNQELEELRKKFRNFYNIKDEQENVKQDIDKKEIVNILLTMNYLRVTKFLSDSIRKQEKHKHHADHKHDQDLDFQKQRGELDDDEHDDENQNENDEKDENDKNNDDKDINDPVDIEVKGLNSALNKNQKENNDMSDDDKDDLDISLLNLRPKFVHKEKKSSRRHRNDYQYSNKRDHNQNLPMQGLFSDDDDNNENELIDNRRHRSKAGLIPSKNNRSKSSKRSMAGKEGAFNNSSKHSEFSGSQQRHHRQHKDQNLYMQGYGGLYDRPHAADHLAVAGPSKQSNKMKPSARLQKDDQSMDDDDDDIEMQRPKHSRKDNQRSRR